LGDPDLSKAEPRTDGLGLLILLELNKRRKRYPYFTKWRSCEISVSALSSSFNTVKHAGPALQTRAGQFILQPTGFRAFTPAPLPPDPPIQRDQEMDALLSAADTNLGRLDGVASILPDPDLFVAMYVRYEAVLSSQIENTQSTLEEVLQFESEPDADHPKDVEEVVNYVSAMNYGLQRLREFPLSLRLIREIHAELMKGVRGSTRDPGEFRRTQNWIGPTGCNLSTATFVPPPVPEMNQALDQFERFLHTSDPMPALIFCALAHAQFETIHPFLDGNGRIGRLLITFLLCHLGVLNRPLLYLSHFFKRHRAEYYDRLMAVRTDGNWEQWTKFFLRGVSEVSLDATETARRILRLREDSRTRLSHVGSSSNLAQRLLDLLFKSPLVTVGFIASQLGCSFTKASQLVTSFQRSELALLEETTGFARNRRFRFKPYLDLFPEAKLPPGDSKRLSGDLFARSTITPSGSRQSYVAMLKVPKAKIQELRQDPKNEVFSDAQLISNYLVPYLGSKVYPIPRGTTSIGSTLYPEGIVPQEIQNRTDSQQVGDITYWLLGPEEV
jgi:Fic family protein